MQPNDVGFMRSLSVNYSNEVQVWLRSHPDSIVSQPQIALLLCNAFIKSATTALLVLVQLICGLSTDVDVLPSATTLNDSETKSSPADSTSVATVSTPKTGRAVVKPPRKRKRGKAAVITESSCKKKLLEVQTKKPVQENATKTIAEESTSEEDEVELAESSGGNSWENDLEEQLEPQKLIYCCSGTLRERQYYSQLRYKNHCSKKPGIDIKQRNLFVDHRCNSRNQYQSVAPSDGIICSLKRAPYKSRRLANEQAFTYRMSTVRRTVMGIC
ncbi:hypothetical protein ILUMI_14406 [Ignelater luminosus]|uniref:Uncharacterized protein n=1 Tax=Ignelater luminosus TaxID=2038154 RepID=A0A8K0CUV5_IGNLU|nr:hypothetical protein ILUMI_14406 [Ignelater luminosus]